MITAFLGALLAFGGMFMLFADGAEWLGYVGWLLGCAGLYVMTRGARGLR